MICNRLKSLVKNWYLQVQNETMAPARMVSFMNQHIGECEECRQDPDVKQEVEKIRAIVLPASKVPKSEGAKEEAVAAPVKKSVSHEDDNDDDDSDNDDEGDDDNGADDDDDDDD